MGVLTSIGAVDEFWYFDAIVIMKFVVCKNVHTQRMEEIIGDGWFLIVLQNRNFDVVHRSSSQNFQIKLVW